MCKGMGCRAVECELRADPYGTNHEADLIDNGVGEDATDVVLQQGINDSIHHHEQANAD